MFVCLDLVTFGNLSTELVSWQNLISASLLTCLFVCTVADMKLIIKHDIFTLTEG